MCYRLHWNLFQPIFVIVIPRYAKLSAFKQQFFQFEGSQ